MQNSPNVWSCLGNSSAKLNPRALSKGRFSNFSFASAENYFTLHFHCSPCVDKLSQLCGRFASFADVTLATIFAPNCLSNAFSLHFFCIIFAAPNDCLFDVKNFRNPTSSTLIRDVFLRWWTLSFSAMIEVIAGVLFTFSVYSGGLKERLNLSQVSFSLHPENHSPTGASANHWNDD